MTKQKKKIHGLCGLMSAKILAPFTVWKMSCRNSPRLYWPCTNRHVCKCSFRAFSKITHRNDWFAFVYITCSWISWKVTVKYPSYCHTADWLVMILTQYGIQFKLWAVYRVQATSSFVFNVLPVFLFQIAFAWRLPQTETIHIVSALVQLLVLFPLVGAMFSR